MGRDLDARGRQAAAGLKAAVAAAELTSRPPVGAKRSRPLVAVLRPAIIIALLLIGTAIGVALVGDSAPPITTTAPPVDTTLAAIVPVQPETAPPTTAYVPPAQTTTSTVEVDTEPPHLEITSPEEGAIFEVKTVTFRGVTEPGASVFSGPWEAEVEESGEWHIVLILSEGSNVARFNARDAAGNESTASIRVHYEPAKPTTTTTIKEEPAEFSAFATFGSCSETPPYDIYYGTGEPGSLITISSEHGSATVEVNEEGNWEKKVFFETAPANKPFIVTISDDLGRSKKFEFVYQPV